jgi:hypothetical protein
MFLKFLGDIMGNNEELIAYLQRAFGYSLTGDISEQCLFFFYGTGLNGKSTLLNVLKGLLGAELCRQTPAETIMARTNSSGPTPELACLKATRAVMTTEVDEGSFLSEALVKQLTGSEPISTRHLYGAPFEYVPRFKLFVAGNHKLVIRGTDYAIWAHSHDPVHDHHSARGSRFEAHGEAAAGTARHSELGLAWLPLVAGGRPKATERHRRCRFRIQGGNGFSGAVVV